MRDFSDTSLLNENQTESNIITTFSVKDTGATALYS